MPKIDAFDGIKIHIFNGDHRPPHIHAVYNDYEILILIESAQIYAGAMPNKQLKKTFDWSTGNADYALEVFYELNPELK